MSSFYCEKCNALCSDTPTGYVTGCEHHPPNADSRSENVIATLLLEVRWYARSLVMLSAEQNIKVILLSGLRTYAQQNELYAQGRTKPGRIVTKSRGGSSNHNFGIAFDVGVFEGKKYLPESPNYAKVGVIGQCLGLEWGGGWKAFKDMPHFQLRPKWAKGMAEKEMLAILRYREKDGAPVYV